MGLSMLTQKILKKIFLFCCPLPNIIKTLRNEFWGGKNREKKTLKQECGQIHTHAQRVHSWLWYTHCVYNHTHSLASQDLITLTYDP